MPTRNGPPNERQLTRVLVDAIRERLPRDWEVRETVLDPKMGQARPDLAIDLKAPDGRATTLVIEVKQVLEGRDVGPLQEQLNAFTSELRNGRGLSPPGTFHPPPGPGLSTAACPT